VLKAGRRAFLVKADIKEAYRVHSQDCHLLKCRMGEFNLVLPFGLRSAPKIFLAVADAVNQGIHKLLHYLDDFILLTKDHSEAIIQKDILITVREKLGVLMEPSKLEGPSG